MKLSKFKNLIKEAVREVLHEEMRGILSEMQQTQNNKHSFEPKKNYESFLPYKTNPVMNKKQPIPQAFADTNDPIKKLLGETAQRMSQEDYQQVAMGSPQQDSVPMAQPDVGEMEEYSPTNMPNFPM